MKISKLLTGILFAGLSLNLYAQQDTLKIEEKVTPYDLISGYYLDNFKPFQKGNFYSGIAFSLTDENLMNSTYLFQQVVEGNRLDYDLQLKGGYFFHDYTMVVLNLNYYQKRFEGTVFEDPDTLQSKTLTRGFALSPSLRGMMPLTRNERLNFYTELGFRIGGNSSLTQKVKNIDEIDRVHKKEINFGVGISPGVTFFALENFALEVKLRDALGYSLTVAEKSTNGGPKSQEITQDVDFRINILALELGLAYYIGAKKIR